MKIGVIGDIHANLPALETVLSFLDREHCVRIVCVGDVVGYGPHPAECIDQLVQRKIPCVRGNHDDWTVSEHIQWSVSSLVRRNIAWTRSVLTTAHLDWLQARPPTLVYGGVAFVHASNAPSRFWPYVRGLSRLERNFEHQQQSLCFNGHTHVPAIGLRLPNGRSQFVDVSGEFSVPKGYRALINPGSVGQPRDGDPRAAFAVCEVGRREIRFHRLTYDVGRTQAAMRAAGLDDAFITRLELGL
jgi:predicted phosphodiesterase